MTSSHSILIQLFNFKIQIYIYDAFVYSHRFNMLFALHSNITYDKIISCDTESSQGEIINKVVLNQ